MKLSPSCYVLTGCLLLAWNSVLAAGSDASPDACPCITNGSWTLAAASVECAAQVIYGMNVQESGDYSRRLTIAEQDGNFCSSIHLYVGQKGGYCQAYLESTMVEGVCSLGVGVRTDYLAPLDLENCEAAFEIIRSDMNSLEDCL